MRFAASCDITGATEVGSDVRGARRFEGREGDTADTILTWYELFPGGCATMQLSSDATDARGAGGGHLASRAGDRLRPAGRVGAGARRTLGRPPAARPTALIRRSHDVENATSQGTGRATGISLAAIVLVLACFGAMVLLHVVRTDLDPVRQVMSEYANGRFGWFMTAAFYAMGLACIALAVRLGRADRCAPGCRSPSACCSVWAGSA